MRRVRNQRPKIPRVLNLTAAKNIAWVRREVQLRLKPSTSQPHEFQDHNTNVRLQITASHGVRDPRTIQLERMFIFKTQLIDRRRMPAAKALRAFAFLRLVSFLAAIKVPALYLFRDRWKSVL